MRQRQAFTSVMGPPTRNPFHLIRVT